MKNISPICWAIAHIIRIFLIILLIKGHSNLVDNAIIPPPWSNPERNPCASLPGGWQLLYWAPLKRCFKIFQIGYPCPDTMELSPLPPGKLNKMKNEIVSAECKCPPGTVLSAITNKCHKIFEQGPCEKGQYFSPIPDTPGIRLSNRWGTCKVPKICSQDMISWPKDGKCYTIYSRGPCPKGKLIIKGENEIAQCKCENSGIMKEYFHQIDETCHEHYTRGPCQIHGEIFLPGGKCGCNPELPHYHEYTNQCYELGTPGPCPPGHLFIIPDNVTTITKRAICQCKEGYIRWKDGVCYRLYTRGPCEHDEFLINSTSCIQNFCGRGRLYFPQQKTCYRIGSQGPCNLHQVVIFDFTSRPSIDGISYKGICGCSGVIMNLDQKCADPDNIVTENTCESTPGMVELDGKCYKLYSRGPCGPGQWLEPYNENTIKDHIKTIKAKCKCRPGYKSYDDNDNNSNHESIIINDEIQQQKQQKSYWMDSSCYPPSVGIARYLTKNFKYNQYISYGSDFISKVTDGTF